MTFRSLLAGKLKGMFLYRGIRDLGLVAYSKIVRRFRFLPGSHRRVEIYLRDFPAPFLCRLGSSDTEVLREVFIDRQYAALQIFPDHSVKTIVDLGANIGLSLCFWSQQYPSAHLFAVEPDRENAKICMLNCALWGIIGRVLLIEACIGRESGHAWLDRGSEPWAYRLSHSSTRVSSETEVISMPDFLNRAQIKGRIDILKCDIEGGEAELMSTCQEWLDRVDVMIMELHAPYSVDCLKKDLVHSLSKFALVVREQKGVAFVILNRLAGFAEQSSDK